MIESAILRCGPGNPHALILQVGQVARLHESANVQKRSIDLQDHKGSQNDALRIKQPVSVINVNVRPYSYI